MREEYLSKDLVLAIVRDKDIEHKERAINRLPSANVKTVTMGEWNEIERGGLLNKYVLFRCTHCGNIFKVYEDTLNAGRGDKNFCPNCGAVMEGKRDV